MNESTGYYFSTHLFSPWDTHLQTSTRIVGGKNVGEIQDRIINMIPALSLAEPLILCTYPRIILMFVDFFLCMMFVKHKWGNISGDRTLQLALLSN